jgi:ATP-dependent protease HslVU (ClpYQ) peptidase subunit
MTTIATDGRSMAGDGQREQNDTIVDTHAVKVCRLRDGLIVGTCGDVAAGLMLIEWLSEGGAEPDFDGKVNALLLHPDGSVDMLDRNCKPIRVSVPVAIGSGMDFAIGAMEFGASPEQAVEIASRRDPNTGGSITVLERADLQP